MSSFDEFTDSSFDESRSSYQKDDPPTLDETIYDNTVCYTARTTHHLPKKSAGGKDEKKEQKKRL